MPDTLKSRLDRILHAELSGLKPKPGDRGTMHLEVEGWMYRVDVCVIGQFDYGRRPQKGEKNDG